MQNLRLDPTETAYCEAELCHKHGTPERGGITIAFSVAFLPFSLFSGSLGEAPSWGSSSASYSMYDAGSDLEGFTNI